jgi:hypothetical protein
MFIVEAQGLKSIPLGEVTKPKHLEKIGFENNEKILNNFKETIFGEKET